MAKRIPLQEMPHLYEARSAEDDWAGISEYAARKKRQNRLNQRAFRRRKAAGWSAVLASRDSTMTAPSVTYMSQGGVIDYPLMCTEKHEGDVVDARGHYIPALEFPMPQDTRVVQHHSRARSSQSQTPSNNWPAGDEPVLRVHFGRTTVKFNLRKQYPLPADHLLTLVRYNVYRGFALNALSIGLDPRTLHDDILSCFSHNTVHATKTLPPPLQPTETQMALPHHPYIDIFPVRAVRDNLLRAGDTFSHDELCADFSGMNDSVEHTGLIIWGEPWDPMGWEISVQIARKWAWLFVGCEEFLRATDFWRCKRGEPPLAEVL
ncbi:hypothetical protein BJ170DRAFT_646450 [Xylariales sp. AK1849]|nr:hypothetical protein BJ170DRAFT_646450 [Xylariales sp. AK1849]